MHCVACHDGPGHRVLKLRSDTPDVQSRRGRLNFKLVQISVFHDSMETVQLKSSSSAECSGQGCEARAKSRRDGTIKSPARKCRVSTTNGSSPGRDGTERPHQALPPSTLTPNLISQARVAVAARPIKSTPQSRPIRSFGQPWLNLAQDASPGYTMKHDLVPQGRLRVVQDCAAAYFQPSLRDWSSFPIQPRTSVLIGLSSAVLAGLSLDRNSHTRSLARRK